MLAATRSLLTRLTPGEIDRLKIFGALLMVIDHIDGIWLLRGKVEPDLMLNLFGGAEGLDTARLLMWLLGRAVYPLFCLVLALHLAAGRLRLDGMVRLLLIGIILQPLFWWARREARLVLDPELGLFALSVPFIVFVKLGLAGLIAIGFARLSRVEANLLAAVACIIGVTAPHALNIVEYLVPGVLLPAFIGRWLMTRDPFFALWSLLALIGCNVSLSNWTSMATMAPGLLAWLFAGAGLVGSIWLARAIPGERRFMGRWSFYIFYPGHYLILTALGLWLFRP
ncbi:MAG: hypothetical protein Alpg2KO_01800 [Alphaproteobacteria bacterium]